jgi:DnaJ-class molecular chaperone
VLGNVYALKDDPYVVLGVPGDSSQEDIKRTYRRLARQHHPDANSGSAVSEQRFKTITAAYTVLSDPVQREQYDIVHGRARSAGARRSRFETPPDPGGAAGAESSSGLDPDSDLMRASTARVDALGAMYRTWWTATWGWATPWWMTDSSWRGGIPG